MSRGEFGSGGYGSARPYRDDPGLGEYRDDPRQGTRGYQSAGYGNFTQLYDTVSSNVFTINNNATSLERALKQIGTNRDSTQLRDKIHNTQLTTNKLISETTKYFRQLSGLRDLERQQKFNIGRIQSEFKDTVQRYNELQKRAAEKVKGASLPAHPARVPTPDTVGWTVFYLIDEGHNPGKGANATISMLHHHLETYGLGETDANIHFDNCVGQNLNNPMMWYLLWRCMTGRHQTITVNTMVTGHTKFAPDWIFGWFKRRWKVSVCSTLDHICDVVNRCTRGGQCIPVKSSDVFFYQWSDYLCQDDRSALIEQDERRRDQLQAQDQIVEDDLAMIQEREERIRQLEGDILDVNEIFRDLAALVYEQGEMIDNIEDNVTKAADHVEEGNTQLTKASEYQKKARKKKCCLVIILVVILGIVGLIIGLSVKK